MSACQPAQQDLKIYAVKYGQSLFPRDQIYDGDNISGNEAFGWMFYVIKYGSRVILVDTGFEQDRYIQMYGLDFKHPLELLKEMDIDPDLVSDVIVSHEHFDHAGCLHHFKNARFIMHEQVLKAILNNSRLPEVTAFLKSHKSIQTFTDSTKLYELFTVENISSHSPGSSVLKFSRDGSDFIIVGDEFYTGNNISQAVASGFAADKKKNREYLGHILKSKSIIMTMHDNNMIQAPWGILQVYPSEADSSHSTPKNGM